MTEYRNKMLVTTRTPGVTIILLTDDAKRGGDNKLQERTLYGVCKEQKEKEEIMKLLQGK